MKHNLSDGKIDVIAGICAGATANFVSHPMDTVKIRIQLSDTKNNLTIRRAFGNIYRAEGIYGFYRGVMSPILGRSPLAGVLFTSLGFAKRKLEPYKSTLSDNQINFIAGFFAGGCHT